MKHSSSFHRLLPIGLIVILLVLSAYAIAVSWLNDQAENQAKHALLLNSTYQSAHNLINEANDAMSEYRLTPGNDLLSQYYSAEASLNPILQNLLAGSAGDEHTSIIQISAGNAEFLRNAGQLVAAVNVGDTTEAAIIENANDRLSASLVQTINGLAAKYQQQAITRITALDQVQHEVLLTTPIVFLFGSVLVWLIWRQLHISQKRLDQRRLQEIDQLSQVALTDSLTGLGNHRAFQEDIRVELARARDQQMPISLALVDIDEFKSLNDGHGHAFGDQVLRALGCLFQQPHITQVGRAYRLGGDEFALILHHASLSQAQGILETLRETSVRSLFGATLSMGVAELTPAITGVTELQEQADAALYEAKRRGRNRLVIFDESLAGTIFLPSMKAAALRHLLHDQQMCIAFQPIWDLSGKRLLAVEALARPDAKYGFAGPQEMFDIAEKMDLVAELDRVCQRAIFAQAHMVPADVLLFINVCPASLEQLAVSDETILRALHAVGLTPQRVVLEVTERAVHQLDTVVSEIERLRKLGFGVALDDTGAGNAGLEMLSSLAVDYVKIDRGILVKAMTDRAARGVLAGIIAIAQETNSYVIAEGIEDVEMFEMMQHIGEAPKQHRMGIRGVQGYLFGRPSMSIPTQVPDIIAEPQQQQHAA